MPLSAEDQNYFQTQTRSSILRDTKGNPVWAIAANGFTSQLSTADLLLAAGEVTPGLRTTIENLGFSFRYANHPLLEPTSNPEELAAARAAALIQQANSQLHSDVPLRVADTSAILSLQLRELLNTELGLVMPNSEVQSSTSYRAACASAVMAFTDGNNCIAACEPLADLLREEHLSQSQTRPDRLLIPGLFGTDHIAWVRDPSRIEILGRHTRILDDQGIIQWPNRYHLTNNDNPTKPPDHYEIQSPGIFRSNRDGIFINVRCPEDGITSINGIRAAKFYSKNTKQVIEEVLYQSQLEPADIPEGNVFIHPASSTLYRACTGQANRLGWNFPEDVTFPIDGGNRSSATILEHLRQNGDQIDTTRPILLAAPGAGSAISACIFQIK